MHNVHFVMQGKGGVGKSLISAFLFQFLEECYPDNPPLAIDGDPLCATLSNYKKIPTTKMVVANSADYDPCGSFDNAIMVASKHNGSSVFDVGSACYLPFKSFLSVEKIIPFIHQNEKKTVIHIPIMRGAGWENMLPTVRSIIQNFQDTNIFVWLNEQEGEIEVDGKRLEQSDFFKEHQDRLAGVCTLPKPHGRIGEAVGGMLARWMTFAEVEACHDDSFFNTLKQQRIAGFKAEVFGQLEQLQGRCVL